jgi:hypothetical protein
MPEDVTPSEGEEQTVITGGETPAGEGEGNPPAENPAGDGGEAAKDAADTAAAEKAAAEKEASGAPDEYEPFQAPEGVELDPAKLETFTPLAKELNLSQENAQKLLDVYADTEIARAETAQQEWDELQDGWVSEAKEDKEIGGDNWNESVAMCAKAVDAFGTPELKEMLNFTGAGNHPELIRMFAKIGKAVSEDKFVFGNAGDGGQKTVAELLYPSMSK